MSKKKTHLIWSVGWKPGHQVETIVTWFVHGSPAICSYYGDRVTTVKKTSRAIGAKNIPTFNSMTNKYT